jgi:hypothetical protein
MIPEVFHNQARKLANDLLSASAAKKRWLPHFHICLQCLHYNECLAHNKAEINIVTLLHKYSKKDKY